MDHKLITQANLGYNDISVLEKELTDKSKVYSVSIRENDINYGVEIKIKATSLDGAMKIFEAIKENS